MTEPLPSAVWVATRDGQIVAEAATAKDLYVALYERQVKGAVTEKVRRG